jgi:hypothetical protein
MTLRIGSDPEFFLKTGEEFISAHAMVPGNKVNPFPVPNGAVQVDGMALEFNIDPAVSSGEFVHNINTVLKSLRGMVPPDFEFAYESVAHFKADHFNKQPKIAKMMGCEPDFDAYSGKENTPPDNRKPMRTAAGHIHVGWNEDGEDINFQKFEEARAMTRQMDYVLGVPSVLIDDGAERRGMYGRAGCFRPKSYGAEYRVLSNFWLKTDELKEWVFNATLQAYNLLMEGIILEEVVRSPIYIINRGNREGAKRMMDRLAHWNIQVPG